MNASKAEVSKEQEIEIERLNDENVSHENLLRLQRVVIEENKKIKKMRNEIHKTIIGQNETVECLIRAILANGHILLEGAPGSAKTLLVNSFSSTVTNSIFKRIQFTPDLLPGDVIGLTAYHPDKGFYTVKGPCFANFLLADEINRAPPKVQSAMLELMQERQVTIGKQTFQLPKPFLVLATQNPVEQEGTFPLPEAQVDRFLFKVLVDYPDQHDEEYIVENNSTIKDMSEFKIETVTSPEDLVSMQKIAKKIYLSRAIRKYIVSLIMTTRGKGKKIKSLKYLAWGASPRASIALFIASKTNAFINDRAYVIPEDVRAVAHHVLRHRILMNYEGKASNITPDDIVSEILGVVPVS